MASLSIDITLARRDFDIDVAFDVSGAVALVGPSGGGKTSILRSVAGLERPQRGRIALDDEVWFSAASIDRQPNIRSIGFVFQEYALFPHMSVAANVAFGARGPVGSVMERVGIAHLANALPDELSGGERQRVAVARALAREPQVLLLDEPTASLDALTREQVRVELAALIAEAAIPTVIVTHDFVEAATLGDRVGVLVDGRLRQLDVAATVLSSPVDDFVARLAGSNVLTGIASPTGGGLTTVRLEDGTEVVSADHRAGPVAVAVLPRHVRVGDGPGDVTRNRVRGRVTSVIAVAGGVRVRIDRMMADLDNADTAARHVAVGDVVTMTFAVTATRLVPVTADGGTERYGQAGVRPTSP